jgi:NAD(P)-dependent dehydrogenase (short-subunit alcohol dehydrogenase family)
MNGMKDKIAIVTGATSGIGARTAELLATEGAHVIIAGRREDAGSALAEKLNGTFVRTDVTVESEVEALVARAVSDHGRLDVLINNAGDAGRVEAITDVDLDGLARTFALHAGGVLAGIKHAARVMIPQRAGSIVNISSIGGHRAGWTGLAYSAAKAASLSLTRGAATELGMHNIRVNSVSPGPIPTGIFAKGAGIDPALADDRADDLAPLFASALEDHQSIHRVGTTDDVAQAALWFASDASAFVTGEDIAVDGGILAGRPVHVGAAERKMMAKIIVG